MQDITVINDQTSYTMYLVRDAQTDITPGDDHDNWRKAQAWFQQYGLSVVAGYVWQVACITSDNGTCPVADFNDPQQFQMLGAIIYAESGGGAASTSRPKLTAKQQARRAAAIKHQQDGEKMMTDLHIGLHTVEWPDDADADFAPMPWVTSVMDALDIGI